MLKELQVLFSIYNDCNSLTIKDIIFNLGSCIDYCQENEVDIFFLKNLEFFVNLINDELLIKEFETSLQKISINNLSESKDISTSIAIKNEKRMKRSNYAKNVTRVLKSWLENNVSNPYPSEDDKVKLGKITGLSLIQINNWFINARRRCLPIIKNSV